MPLLPGIIPNPGEVFMCNFSGYVIPEIVKLRRVVVVSPRNPGARLVTVVPISTTAPHRPSPVQVELPGKDAYPCFDGADRVWAKADLIAHVCFSRLDRVRISARDADGNIIPRKYTYLPTVTLAPEHLDEVRKAVLYSVGLGRLWPVV